MPEATSETSSLHDFETAPPRPFPVLLLADTSTSMRYEGKIDALNHAAPVFIDACADLDTRRAEIHVAVMTFGEQPCLRVPLQPARQAQWAPLQPQGRTPLGAALDAATDLLEDPETVPSRGYRPVVLLISDGEPTDAWQPALRRFREGRSGKAQRLALQVAPAPGPAVTAFCQPADPITTTDAEDIVRFFEWAAMSLSRSARSARPGDIPPVEEPETLGYF